MKRKREIVKKVKLIMNLAQQEAKNNGDRELKPEHIVLAILNEETNKSNIIIKSMGIDTLTLYDEVSEHLRHSQLDINIVNVVCIAEKIDYAGAKRIEEATGLKIKSILKFSAKGKKSKILEVKGKKI